jgi:hypothetical protein
MNIQSTKIELAKLILELENPSLIKKIKSLIMGESSDFWNLLNESEKEEIEQGLKMLNKGQRISFEDFLKKVS